MLLANEICCIQTNMVIFLRYLYIFVWAQHFWGATLNCYLRNHLIMNCLIKELQCSKASHWMTFLSPRLRRGYCYRLHPSVRYAISSQTAGQNPTKFGEWLAYTSGACKSTFIFGPAPRGPGEGSKGQILISVGICDGVPSTARSNFSYFSGKTSFDFLCESSAWSRLVFSEK